MRDIKKEFYEFMDRFDDVEIRIGKALEVENDPNAIYDSLFYYIENPDSDDYRDYDEKWINRDKELIQNKYDKYTEILKNAVEERNKLFEEKFKIHAEFLNWKVKNGVKNKTIYEYSKTRGEVELDWLGWDSSNIIYETMIASINKTDVDEVNKLIENMKKVIELLDDEDGYGCYMEDDWIYYLEIINNEARYYKNEYAMTTLALDIMENHRIYQPYKESFKTCLLNICNEVDIAFLCGTLK